jgi:hypothetical protein
MATSLEIAIRLNLKVERAKKHILDLEAEWHSFLDGNPYGIEIKDDVNTGDRVYYLVRDSSIPQNIPLIIGDAIQNLRSALDHLAYHFALIGPKGAVAMSRVYFPIVKSATEYRSGKASGKMDFFRKDAVDYIDAIEPYGGGKGQVLWILHTLNNIDKHRLLVTALADLTGHTALPSQLTKMASDLSVSPERLKGAVIGTIGKRFPLKAGDVLLAVPKGEVNEKMQFLVNPAFAEPKIVHGWPITPTLHEMMQFVRAVIMRCPDHCLL